MLSWDEPSALANLCLYLPPLVWLLPLLALSPLSLLLGRPKLLLWHLLSGALVLLSLSDWQWSFNPDEAGALDLTCVSNNLGDNHGESLKPFLDEQKPDIIALQDAGRDGPRLTQSLPPSQYGRATQAGRFMLISRHPVLKTEEVLLASLPDYPVAARHELNVRGQVIALYNVHLPTPRGDFRSLKSWAENQWRNPSKIGDLSGWRKYARALGPRLALARELSERIQQEPLPCVVLGDFNTPSGSYAHRVLTRSMTDCFRSAGNGVGSTFPGDSPYLASLFQPWLRLDYIFAGKGWQVLECETESSRRSQHRAVVARLRFTQVPGS
jgi:endonuclease/exonuclease/phosphatase (EEP) superfamily protein YafD